MAEKSKNNSAAREVVGLIPAAGKASRIAPLPCSKELYPIGFRTVDKNNGLRPKVVSHYLLEKMRLADITKVYCIIRDGKWDIPSYFGDGALADMHIAYLMMNMPFGVPFTLDQAYPFVQNSIIALGFPDIMFEPENAYRTLLLKLFETKADIVLGLFPAEHHEKTDMVDLDENGKVMGLHIKPKQTELSYTWQIAVWTPCFTRYMHDYVLSSKEVWLNENHREELYVGDIIQAALNDNMNIESVLFKDGSCLDIGTPKDLMRSVRLLNEEYNFLH